MLAVGTAEAIAPARTTTETQVAFQFGPLPAGAAWVRLRVDGIESALVDRSVTPPEFLADRSLEVPS
jgi:hypothetical protein